MLYVIIKERYILLKKEGYEDDDRVNSSDTDDIGARATSD
jgi:hypothetical protein